MRMANRRVWSIFLAFMMLISMLPMSVSAEGNFIVDSGGALQDALEKASSGDVITLSKDITITDEELKEAQKNSGVFVIPEGVMLKGNGKTIRAEDANIWKNSKNQFHILSVEGTADRSSSDPTTTIIDLTVVGNENTKSGINAYCCVGTVELQNVTIQNCGNAAVQVNGSRVTADELNTSGNRWGAVNVDKGSGVTSDTSFTLTSGNLQEPVKIWTELTDQNNVITVPDDWTPVTGGNNTAFGPVEDVRAAFPAVENEESQTVYYQSLDLAVQHAGNGDTIVLPAGTFELTGNIEIEKAVNLRGAGADQTVIKGSVMYNVPSTASNSESITVEGLKIQATKDDSHQALCWSRQNELSGYTLNVKNCAFDGWQYGIGVNSSASGCTLNVSDTVFENTFCAISIKETLKGKDTNKVGTLENVETAAGAYAVQSFSTGTTPFNGYYSSVENYLEDKKDGKLDAADWTPHAGETVPTDWEARMSNGSGGYTYGSLQDLIGKVTGTNQVTIELAKDVTLSSPISVSGNKNIVIEGKDHMISFAYASALDTAFEVAASSKGTSLIVNNVHFVQTEGISQGHAICVREVTENVNVAAGGCTFENLYSGIYYGHVEKGSGSLSITGSTFENTKYGYAIDEVTSGSLVDVVKPTYSGNTGEVTEQETFQNIVVTSSTDGTKKAYQTLADAIQNAGSGDTVTLSSGTYELEEDACIVLNKKLTIEGAGDKTVIKGSGKQDYQNGLFTFTGGSEGSVLKDLTIEYTSSGAQRAAVYFDYGFTKGNNDNVTKIQNVKFVGSAEDKNRDNEKALAVSSTYMEGGFIEITGCDFKNFAYGMYFNRVHDLTVKDNTIDGTKYNAINIAGDNGACKNIVIQGNTMTDISYGNYADDLYSSGISLGQDVSNVTIEANTIEMLHNKQPIYVQEAEGGETKTVTVTYQVKDSDYAVLIVPVTDGKAVYAAPADPEAPEGFTFAGWDYGTVEATTENGQVSLQLGEETAITVTAVFDEVVQEPEPPHSGGNIVPSIDRGDGIGTPLPEAGEGSGTPSASGFTSDTNADLTVDGRYQFRITSLDGHTPVLTVNNSNFTVTLASQSGRDYFYVITCAGTPGSTAAVSVDGKYLLTATVGGSASGVVSDTTHPFTVAQGGTYQFRLTAAERPSFAAGSASFTVEYAGQIGNDYFYKVHAVGQPGDGCGFYINGEAAPVAVATIA